MDLDLVPLAQFSQRIASGWQMIVGYPLEAGDFAVIMAPPGWRADNNAEAGRDSGEQTKRARKFRNVSRAAAARNRARQSKRWEKIRRDRLGRWTA